MAIPGEIQIGRISRFFSKFTGSKGPSGRFSFGNEIQPGLQLLTGVENRYLESWSRFGILCQQPAGAAGTFAFVNIRNPLGSNLLVVIERAVGINDSAGAASLFLYYGGDLAGADGATVFIPQILDARAGPNTGSAMKTTGGNPAGGQIIGTAIDKCILPASTQYSFISGDDLSFLGPIMPGNGIQIATSIAAVSMSASFVWRQRVMEESELT